VIDRLQSTICYVDAVQGFKGAAACVNSGVG